MSTGRAALANTDPSDRREARLRQLQEIREELEQDPDAVKNSDHLQILAHLVPVAERIVEEGHVLVVMPLDSERKINAFRICKQELDEGDVHGTGTGISATIITAKSVTGDLNPFSLESQSYGHIQDGVAALDAAGTIAVLNVLVNGNPRSVNRPDEIATCIDESSKHLLGHLPRQARPAQYLASDTADGVMLLERIDNSAERAQYMTNVVGWLDERMEV